MDIDILEFKKAYQTLGFTQSTLAKRLQIKRSTISQWITLKSIPDKYLIDIENVLGKSFLEKQDENDIAFSSKNSIPYYDIDVTAGNMSVFEDQGEYAHEFVSFPGLVADFVVPVHGNSMYPSISNGDWIAVKELKDLDFINYGHKYLIVTNEQRMVKTIRKGTSIDHICLASDNTEFDSFEINKKKINRLYIVVQIMKRETM